MNPVSSVQLRPVQPSDAAGLQAVWDASLRADDPAYAPGADIGVESTDALVYQDGAAGERVIGALGIRYQPPGNVATARVALDPASRLAPYADHLVAGARRRADLAGAQRARLALPKRSTWAAEAVARDGWTCLRSIYRMLRPEGEPDPPVRPVPGLRIRQLREDEDDALLAALNAAWADTWSFRPITAEALRQDLAGQRQGMLVGLEEASDSPIVGTCHAIFDPARSNPDGSAPRAWISNVTTLPAWRGKGVARALLGTGLADLRRRGARSIGLGVDGGNPAPVALYQSVGFRIFAETQIWERPLR